MNRKIAAGLALLGCLIALSLLAPLLAPFELGHTEGLRHEIRGGEDVYIYAPERPSERHVLGSDRYGYDMLTEMLHGLKWSLGAVFGIALLRSALAFLLGLLAAGKRGPGGSAERFSPLAAFPSFIISYFFIYPVTINSPIAGFPLFLYQCLVIALLDLNGLARSFSATAKAIHAASFVEAARTSGADGRWIAARHIAPFLFDEFLEALPVQAIAAASSIAKLGLFSLFMGGTRMAFDPPLLQPAKMELIGLMGYHNAAILGAPWLFLGPFSGWLLIFAASELLASGLRDRAARRRRLYY